MVPGKIGGLGGLDSAGFRLVFLISLLQRRQPRFAISLFFSSVGFLMALVAASITI